jgi:NAD(P)-dependent dehydrogenase (short-subunit alcohol dehydrogenase family)
LARQAPTGRAAVERARPPRPAESLTTTRLDGRVVVVTGGAQGIGRGIAQCVLASGASVAIVDVAADAGRSTLREWDVGDRARFFRADVSRPAQVRRAIDGARSAFGRIDALVNNAARADPVTGPVERLSPDAWNRILASNLTSAFLASRAAIPALRKARGAIVNIASTRAHQSEPHTEAYAACKGGIVALTHALAVSLGPSIRVNCISPGWIATEAWQRPGARRRPKLARDDHAQHPAGRVGTPEDVGALTAWLLSPAAGFVTGQEFVVDGGMSRRMRYD